MGGCVSLFAIAIVVGALAFIAHVLQRLTKLEEGLAALEAAAAEAQAAAERSRRAEGRLLTIEARISKMESARSEAVPPPVPPPVVREPAVIGPVVPEPSVLEQTVLESPAPEVVSLPEPAIAPAPQPQPLLPPVEEPRAVGPLPEPSATPAPVAHVPAEALDIASRRGSEVPPPAPAGPEPDQARSWSDALREGLAGEEWEAVVGGSWLNKIGVGVLVIGVALLLGYSFARMGPAGRVAMGLSISLAMLLGGVWVERRDRYVIFARGLIGGGWAALYFTAYAMHGLEAARMIDSALAGTTLLTAVAAGMIGHSLRYQSQVVTGLGYFLAFVALSLGGAPGFSLVALVPLSASLLVVTRRFSWAPMMLAGLGLTYGTYLVAASGSPHPTLADFVRGEAVLAVYWLLFEGFDLVELGRGRTSPITAAISPLNAFAFLGISMLQWEAMTPDTVYLLLGGMGVMYTASAIVRARLRPPASFGADSTVMDRALAGSYELTITLATLLLAWGSMQRFDGLRLALALFLEAEMLFSAGRSLGQRYLRLIGTLLMIRPLAQIAMVAASSGAVVVALGIRMAEWVPLASLFALTFYLNRASLRGRAVLVVERAYDIAASAIVMIVVFELTPRDWLAVAWFAVAIVFHEVGARTRAGRFRLHAYVAVALSLAAVFTTNIVTGPPHQWPVPAMTGALCYALALRQVFGSHRAADGERTAARAALAIPGSVLAAIVCWMLVPERHLGVAWMVLALLLHEAGARTRASDLRVHSYLAAAIALFRVFDANIVTDPPRQWPVPALAGALSYALALRQVYGRHRAPSGERDAARSAAVIPGSLLAAVVCWMVVPEQALGPAWLALSLGLYEAAARTRAADLRFHAYVAAVAGFGWVAVTNLPDGPDRGWVVPALAAALGYVLAARQVYGRNRLAQDERLYVRAALTAASSAMTAAVFWVGLPDPYFRLAWLLFAAALFEFGVNSTWTDLKLEAYALGALGVVSIGMLDALGPVQSAWPAWVNMGSATAVLAATYVRLSLLPPRGLAGRAGERDMVRHACSGAAMFFMGAMVWHAHSVPLMAIGWAAVALLAIETGLRLEDGVLRAQGHAMLALSLVRLLGANFDTAEAWRGISTRLLTVPPMIAVYALQSARLRSAARSQTSFEGILARWYPWIPATLAALLVVYQVGPEFVGPWWLGLAVALLALGLRRRIDACRVQGYLLGAGAAAVCLATNFNEPGWGDPALAWLAAIALCFAAQLISPRPGATPLTDRPAVHALDGHARMGFALAGTILLTVLLYCQASARALTVAWGIEAAAILVFGFVAHERALRLSGLLLLAGCIVKLFAMDFRGLDPLPRIVSFIVLGVLLVAASWVYTRYREQLHRYL